MRFGYVVRPRADRDIDEIVGYLAEEARLDMAPQVTTPIFDPMFSEHSYGFRPGRSAQDAFQISASAHRRNRLTACVQVIKAADVRDFSRWGTCSHVNL